MAGRIPQLFVDAGDESCRNFIEFFTANIRNRNTREAYFRAVKKFADWCDGHKLKLNQLSPPLVAAYVEQLGKTHSVPSVKQHLAAIRMVMSWLVIGQSLNTN